MAKLTAAPSPKVTLLVSSGSSYVAYKGRPLAVPEAKRLAEQIAKEGFWVAEEVFWPANSITSITLEPIRP